MVLTKRDSIEKLYTSAGWVGLGCLVFPASPVGPSNLSGAMNRAEPNKVEVENPSPSSKTEQPKSQMSGTPLCISTLFS